MDLLLKYFPNLSDKQISQFESLKALYVDWNDKINVISRKDLEAFDTHHLLHSLSIAKHYQFKKGTKILDVGTGGGFPGIPLAIFFPEVDFYLVDSIGKKIKVVKAVAESLELNNVRADHIRAEEVKGKYDFVVSRAVTRLKNFLPWVDKKISKNSINDFPNGMIFIKGGDLTEEISEVKYDVQLNDLSADFDEDFFETKKLLYISLFS